MLTICSQRILGKSYCTRVANSGLVKIFGVESGEAGFVDVGTFVRYNPKESTFQSSDCLKGN